jgi:hypothetical protein
LPLLRYCRHPAAALPAATALLLRCHRHCHAATAVAAPPAPLSCCRHHLCGHAAATATATATATAPGLTLTPCFRLRCRFDAMPTRHDYLIVA